MRPGERQGMGLLGPVTAATPIAGELPADGRGVAIEEDGDFGLAVTGFHQGVDLVTFFLGEVCVVTHRCSSFLAD